MKVPKWIARVPRELVRGVVLVLGERAVLRAGIPGAIARAMKLPASVYRPHHYTLYELSPNWRSKDGRTSHNSLGFRGREVTVAKLDQRVRIVCMGESTTYCTGIENDEATYPARLEMHLRRARPDLDIEVVNAGVGGYTSIENLLRCLFHVVPLSPDLIIYYYTHNDVHPRRMPTLSRDYREYSRSWYEPWPDRGILSWLKHRRALASGYIGRIVRRDYERRWRRPPQENVRNNPPHAFRANMTAFALIARASGATLLFVNPPYRELARNEAGDAGGNPRSRGVWEHREIIKDIGQKLGVAIYDLAEHMPFPAAVDAFPNEHYLDPVHVNETGADVMGRLVAEAVLAKDLLAAKNRPDKLI